MIEFLSEAWFARLREVAADLPPRPGVDGRVQCEVAGGPEGTVVYHVVVADGRLVEAERGPDPEAALTLTATWADHLASAQAGLDPSEAYMRGKLKASSVGPLLELLPLLQSPEGAAVGAAMAAELG